MFLRKSNKKNQKVIVKKMIKQESKDKKEQEKMKDQMKKHDQLKQLKQKEEVKEQILEEWNSTNPNKMPKCFIKNYSLIKKKKEQSQI